MNRARFIGLAKAILTTICARRKSMILSGFTKFGTMALRCDFPKDCFENYGVVDVYLYQREKVIMYPLTDQNRLHYNMEEAFIPLLINSTRYNHRTKGKQAPEYLQSIVQRLLSAIVLQRPPISQVSPSPPQVWQPLASLPELSLEFSQPEPLQQQVWQPPV